MKEIKSIYEFYLKKVEEKEIKEETPEGVLTKKEKAEVPVKVIFKKPSRTESDEADFIYAQEYGKCVRAGILTKGLLEKLYDEKDKGGILSDDFSGKYFSLVEKFWRIQNEYTKLDLQTEKTEEDKLKLNTLAVEFALIRDDIQTLEATRNNLFQNTAETKANNKTILWLTLFLTYIKEENRAPRPFFNGVTFEEKLAQFDELNETNDEFGLAVVDKMAFFVTIWFLGKASSKEDFAKLDQNLNTPKKEVKVEESPVKDE